MFYDGKVKLSRKGCPVLIRQLSNYRWNPKRLDDVPLKEDDHGPDALRYFVWALQVPKSPVRGLQIVKASALSIYFVKRYGRF